MIQLLQHSFAGTNMQPVEPNVTNIGNQMLGIKIGGYSLPFEVVSMLLLAALIGCIVIAAPSSSPKRGELAALTLNLKLYDGTGTISYFIYQHSVVFYWRVWFLHKKKFNHDANERRTDIE